MDIQLESGAVSKHFDPLRFVGVMDGGQVPVNPGRNTLMTHFQRFSSLRDDEGSRIAAPWSRGWRRWDYRSFWFHGRYSFSWTGRAWRSLITGWK